ncbi:glutathione S-transferase family protein [Thalassotalea atypica]|uniref:glutathione S-transferase family protein n=1 Tax=Thalassotalea atypica TaxID=2054316 RepID=UPI0025743A48|nr:glutathione S-transferase family protein [Thalassotalea atypica]
MIKIVSFTICPFVQRVTALLAAKQVPFEVEYISLKDKPQWFLDISPTGQVPLLITENDTVLFESDAIVEYIDEVSSQLEPERSAEQKAIDRAWSYQAAKHYLVQCSAMTSADQDTLAIRTEKLAKAFAKAEQQLTRGPYWKGETLSNVDIAWLPLLHRAAIIEQHTCYDFLAKFPRVKAWQTALMKTDLITASVSVDFEEKFTQFYLSDKTYLGNGNKSVVHANDLCSTGNCC